MSESIVVFMLVTGAFFTLTLVIVVATFLWDECRDIRRQLRGKGRRYD